MWLCQLLVRVIATHGYSRHVYRFSLVRTSCVHVIIPFHAFWSSSAQAFWSQMTPKRRVASSKKRRFTRIRETFLF
ncbi:uncharacterized protein K460DRAFT_98312 [Cucurbitaria berberidis CBS 394.84]|uniref:Uncharacterized protein n=1 Tax=Cucurbitaria berberidis CBS 394.84 TaxID=1168544 RepID=A0A9P4L784_9PLEO|nr:uncharacterized protein K460DRAFT_98312 [Cucurbitaria berberidis CBS 394.84]KAF1844776.1 hypothetical protein K460DRAFT_98312 [Cucurbitaria berberidis CBS 394.84]